MNDQTRQYYVPTSYQTYQPDAQDVLWLSRAVEFEGEPKPAVAQALVNRFMWLRVQFPTLYPTLREFVIAYSRPVNPRWSFDGDLFAKALKQAKSEEQAQRLQRVAEKIQRQRLVTSFDESTEAAVNRALYIGPVDLPTTDTMDFGGPFRKVRDHLLPRTQDRRGVNRFYAPRSAEGWPGYEVTARQIGAPVRLSYREMLRRGYLLPSQLPEGWQGIDVSDEDSEELVVPLDSPGSSSDNAWGPLLVVGTLMLVVAGSK